MKKLNSPLKSLFWDNGHDDVLIIVGGDGDNRFMLRPLIEKVLQEGLELNVITFSFTGLEEDNLLPIKQQVEDLKKIAKWALEKHSGKVAIACTSAGAYSTSHILTNPNFSKRIDSAIFIDPADYYLDKENEIYGGGTWTGLDNYEPDKKTASDLLRNIDSDIKIHVINSTLKNYSENGYVDENKRHIDNPACHPRLNDNMAKSFYKSTPDKNKGEYIEDNELPHAFLRDGNIKRNVERLAKFIIKIINL